MKLHSNGQKKFRRSSHPKKSWAKWRWASKMGKRRVQIAQSAIISLNIVNGSLGRESALFVGVQRGEKFSTLMWESQQLIHRLFATYEERAPMHSLLMCYACAVSKILTPPASFWKRPLFKWRRKMQFQDSEVPIRNCGGHTYWIKKVPSKCQQEALPIPTDEKSRSRCHGQKTNWIKIRIVKG